jgi:hypothetical protein
VHLGRFREADGLADQAFDPRAEGQRRALNLLGVPFARTVHVRVQMSGVRPPMIGIEAGESEGLEQRFELQKDECVPPFTHTVTQRCEGLAL